jgi:hypothetical protein
LLQCNEAPYLVLCIAPEVIMPYALFSHADQVSKAFASKAEVWDHAARRGLVVELGSSEEDPPRRVLDMGYIIRECAQDTVAAPAATSRGQRGIAQLVAGTSVNPPLAAAAS